MPFDGPECYVRTSKSIEKCPAGGEEKKTNTRNLIDFVTRPLLAYIHLCTIVKTHRLPMNNGRGQRRKEKKEKKIFLV